MKNKDITKSAMKEAASALQQAMAANDEEAIKKAWEGFQLAVKEAVKSDIETEGANTADASVMAARGVRQLTSEEREYWNKFIAASKSSDYKNAIANIDVSFPETIIEDVYREITDKHPLLASINFQNVSVLTKWILSDHTSNAAVWGEINSTITEEISGKLKKIDLQLCKLSSFAIVPLDMLELGADFIDKYIRTLLVESIALGLENGIVKGSGHNEPIGLIRDIHDGVSVSSSDGYPLKEAVKVKRFDPLTYGALCAKIAVTEKGNPRTVPEVTLICNQLDYFLKIMPASTALGADGKYVNNLFPHPTKVIISNSLPNGKAVLCLLDEYFFGLGSNKQGTMSYSDEFKFLEDARTFKIKLHGNGRCYDNTCAIYLDINELEPVYFPVEVMNNVYTSDAVFNVSLEVDPKASASVSITDSANASVGTCKVSKTTGKVTAPKLKNGVYTATISASGYTTQTVTFTVAGEDVELEKVTLVSAG